MDNNYQRLFYIFKNMDTGIGTPTGYIKVEINCEAVKLQISINNLSDNRGRKYHLYGISKDDKQLRYTDICDIPIINGRAEIKLNTECKAVGSNRMKIEEINIYSILAQDSDRNSFICPLAAYTKEELDWKSQFENLILAESKVENQEAETQIQPDENPEFQIQVDEQPETLSPASEQSEKEVIDTEVDIQPEEEFVELSEDISLEEELSIDTDDAAIDNTFENKENVETDTYQDLQDIPNSGNDILSSVEKDFHEILSFDNNEHVSNLRDELDKSFEKYNPFKTKSKRFRWWKVNSPGYLNNILFRNNIKTYLLFSPNVLLAHYKYRYIIFGIRAERHSGRDILICGIPGVYGIDENPFTNIGSWVQLEGYRPKYGAFGYWVVMIDSKTGKLVKIK